MKKEYLIYKLSEDLKEATRIENELFRKFDVKRGLRNEDGTGVLVGLTKIGNVVGYERIPGGGLKPIPGKLFYRGYDVDDLAHAIIKEKRFGFEEIAYLLLSGRLPDKEELSSFRELINDNMPLEQKTKMNIIELEGNNIMNILARSVLEMYRFDPDADDTSRDNLMRQSIELISKFPTIIAYAYNMLRHATHGRSLHIRHPQEDLSIAENFLYMLKKDYTELDARTLDLLLVLQAEHGGGNNSTFTVRVTSSTGTDTYSSIAAGIGSLKGPLHGGANIQVADMFHHLQENIQDWTNVDEIDTYFTRMLNREAYNKTGLIYGIGHAVYTISDPRAILLKELARDLAARFNARYSPTFAVPEPFIPQNGARIMSLSEPTAKMSKSDDNDNGYVSLTDSPDVIRRKFRRAVTDSDTHVRFGKDKPAISNLLTIYSRFSGISIERIVEQFEGRGYGELKDCVADAVIAGLEPVQKRLREFSADKSYIAEALKRGAEQAAKRAEKTLSKVYRKIGFVPRF